uniref:Fibronectin type-III domain-containing protein n=1 Tax=Amphimedon queenslandica TaxID=400682 RepID=A0A1X7SFV9_AMPQE
MYHTTPSPILNLACPELSSVNETVFVAPHQSTTTYSYTLIGLYSGMNYTITVKA